MTSPSPTARARVATVVVVGPVNRLTEASEALGNADEAGALRVILVSTESDKPRLEIQPDVVSIGGLRPEHVNNAIAAVRLSSLPTVVWWRGGRPEGLDGVAALADRVILDAVDPWPLWNRAVPLFDHTAMSDLRWATLTRWRAAMAHFFDLPEVRDEASRFSRLRVSGSDRALGALFAAWLDTSLDWSGRVAAEFLDGGAPLETVLLAGETGELALRLLPNQTCLDTSARLPAGPLAFRVVSAGDHRLSSLLSEELRVRSRDPAFERALRSSLLTQSRTTHPDPRDAGRR